MIELRKYAIQQMIFAYGKDNTALSVDKLIADADKVVAYIKGSNDLPETIGDPTIKMIEYMKKIEEEEKKEKKEEKDKALTFAS